MYAIRSYYVPFLTFSEKRDLREKIYRAYFMRGDNDNENDNKAIIEKIVPLRDQKAKLLGFDNFAAYVADVNIVITSYSIHYTKLYEALFCAL